MGPDVGQHVPAHVGNGEGGIGRRDPLDRAGYPAEPARFDILAADIGHQLHADADAQERNATAEDGFSHGGDDALARGEAGGAVRIVADAGQDDAVGLADAVRIVCQDHIEPDFMMVRRRLKRALHGADIARSIVDDGEAGHGEWGVARGRDNVTGVMFLAVMRLPRSC